MLVNRVEAGRYLDSVALMRVSRRLEALPGIEAAALMIGSPSNKALLRDAGLLAPDGEKATSNDLIIAVRGTQSGKALQAALEMLLETKPAGRDGLPHARSLAGALELLPQASLALISVPGEFAAYEARKALERGLNALVFSDNVPIEDEAALKRFAAQRQLLLMGPDCGTALIAGTPIAFANAVPRGDIGIVSASGTGLQEVSSLIARMGGGVSHGIGVGGRDLDARIGALGTLAAIDALERDPGTARMVLISKPPAREVARTEGGHRAGAHVGDRGGVHDRERHPGLGREEVEQRHLRGQPELVVADEVAHDLDSGHAQRLHVAAQDVEVPLLRGLRHQVHARLDDALAEALGAGSS